MKKCPFCGGSPSLMEGTKFSKVECSICGSRTAYCSNAEEAINAWDNRYETDPLKGEDNFYICHHTKTDGPYPDIIINRKYISIVQEN